MKKAILIIAVVVLVILLGALIFSYRDKFFPVAKKEPYKVAIVLLGGAYQKAVDGMIDEMKNIGYVEGENILYFTKDTQGDQEAIVPATRELLEKNPDVFYTIATPVTTRVWKEIGESLPIVFNIIGDPIGAGFAKSYASSETNLTGCSNLSAELSGKRLEIFKEAFPGLKKVVTFYDPDNKFSQLSIANLRQASPGLGVEAVEIHVKTIADLEKALADLKPGQYDGIHLTPDAMVISRADLVVKRASQLKIPVMGHEETLAEKGVTVAYGADFYKLGVQSASILLRVLQGQKPKDIPIQGPRELVLVVNLKSAQESGLFVSPEILGKADKVIQ